MSWENIIFEKKERIATLTLNRPSKLNAMDKALLGEFDAAVAEVERDPDVAVLIIRGAGSAFCAGYDLSPGPFSHQGYATTTEVRDLEGPNVARWLHLWSLPAVVLAQVHGYCLAGGADLMLACDLAIASEDAQIGYPVVRMTGTPAMMLWPWLIGMRKTKELLFTGDSVDGREAERIGLVNRAVPADRLEEEVMRLADRIAKVPPELLRIIKFATNKAFEIMGLRNAVDYCFELHAIGHFSRPVLEFEKMVREKGLRAALEARDAPFRR